jgi:hypothetical protein
LNYKDYSTGAAGITYAIMFPTVPGVGPSGRTGEKTVLLSIDLHLSFFSAGNVTGSCVQSTTIRVILAIVKQPGGAGLPAGTGVGGLLDSSVVPIPYSS